MKEKVVDDNQKEMNNIRKEAVTEIILTVAALSSHETTFKMEYMNANIGAYIDCIEELGAEVEMIKGGFCKVTPFSSKASDGNEFLPIVNCRDNPAALRVLIPIMAALRKVLFVSGTGMLAKTPFDDMRNLMEARGSVFRYDHFPFELSGALTAGIFEFKEGASPQLIAGIMLSAPIMEGDSEIIFDKNVGDDFWIDIAETVMIKFGIEIRTQVNGYIIKGGQKYRAPETIDADELF